MRRREPPCRRIDPGPSPGRQVAPRPVAVGHPIDRQILRAPDVAVGRVVGPIAVRGEKLAASDAERQVRRVVAGIARTPPRANVKSIGRGRADDAVLESAAQRRVSGKDLNPRRVVRIARDNVVVPRRDKPHPAAGEIDLDGFAEASGRKMQEHPTLRQADLNGVAVELYNLQLARRIERQQTVADTDVDPGAPWTAYPNPGADRL